MKNGKEKRINKNRRLSQLFALVVFFFICITFALVNLMVFQHASFEDRAMQQWTKEVSVASVRGKIVDANGEVLAQSATVKSVMILPKNIEENTERQVAQLLSQILDLDEQSVYEKCIDKTKTEVWLKRFLTNEQVEQIETLNISGVKFFTDSKRYYPYGSLAAQVLGYTNADGDGQEGLEKVYDDYLNGYDGTALALIDATGRVIDGTEEQFIAPEDGSNVVLTIDAAIQGFAESAAKEACTVNEASNVVCIVMEADTSDVKAMVTYPEADLNDLPRNDVSLLNSLARNSAVADSYEPGSTFKIITTASALDSGAVTPSTSFTCNGYSVVNGEKISCWRSGNPHGVQDLSEALQNSCNPCFITMALEMGKDNFYDYIKEFGFGNKTGINCGSESAGILTDEKYVTDNDLARIGFGQSIAVTPIQLCNSVCAVVNGGTLNTPSLVSAITDEEGNVIEDLTKKEGKRVISEATSATMRELLFNVVEEGSGSNAKVEGYSIGGKTGTAQLYENGQIAKGKNISSFIGFAPAEDPKYVVLFIVYEPQVAVTYGSVVAAPYAGKVLEKTLKYADIPADEGAQAAETVKVPEIMGLTQAEAQAKLTEAGLVLDIEGEGEIIAQSPAKGTLVLKGSTVAAVTAGSETGESVSVGVPDLAGKSFEEAQKLLEELGYNIKSNGENTEGRIIAEQFPLAGEEPLDGRTVIVKFKTQE